MLAKPKKIKVSYDISQVGKFKAGCGFYVHSLISKFQDRSNDIEWNLMPHFGDFFYDGLMPVMNPYQIGHYGPRMFSRDQAQKFWNHPQLEDKLGHPNIIHANNFWCPTNLKQTRLIYTLYDLGFLKNYTWTTEENRIGCFDGVFKAAAYSDFITVISQFTKNHFLQLFPNYPADRIAVIYPCSRFSKIDNASNQRKEYNTLKPRKFWLSVGTIEPRKNQRFLAKVYAEYVKKSRNNALPLVFAGKKGWLMDDFEHYLQDLGIRDKVMIFDYVSDEDLIWLYSNCYANFYPSIFEGFGMPVLEAIQLGAPTISTKNSSMAEILVHDEMLLSLDRESLWVDMMLKLQKDLNYRNKLGILGQKEANKFTWEASAQKLEDVYHQVLSLTKR